MNKYLIRFNKDRGKDGAGSIEHVWRVFENKHNVESMILAKQVFIHVPSWSEKTVFDGKDDWNIACMGRMTFHEEFQIVEIFPADN
jgi:hypothetical protein